MTFLPHHSNNKTRSLEIHLVFQKCHHQVPREKKQNHRIQAQIKMYLTSNTRNQKQKSQIVSQSRTSRKKQDKENSSRPNLNKKQTSPVR